MSRDWPTLVGRKLGHNKKALCKCGAPNTLFMVRKCYGGIGYCSEHSETWFWEQVGMPALILALLLPVFRFTFEFAFEFG